MFVATMVIQHPFCKNAETGKPALVLGPTMLTQKKSQATYAVFANYLRECLIGVGVDVLSEDWVFNFVTDGERALYEAFRQAFPRHIHTLCVLHIRKGIERYFDGKKKTASEIAFVMNTIFGYTRTDGLERRHIMGLIDSVSKEAFVRRWTEIKIFLGDVKFQRWFERNHQKNFLEKLILPARETMGFSRDLPNKNLAEAEHKALKAFFGKHKDPREVAPREEFAKDLLLSREEAHDDRHILAKLKNMFPKCDVQAMVLTVTRRQVAPGKSSSVSLPELPEFLTTGLAPMFANSWNPAMELLSGGDVSDWIVQLSDLEWLNFKNRQHVAIVRKVLSSDKKKNIWYFVDKSLTTGEGKCSCYQSQTNRDPACKHIISVAATIGQVDRLVEWLKVKKSTKVVGSWTLTSTGENKPVQKQMTLRGKDFTKRTSIEALDMDFQEEGFCFRGEGCANVPRTSFMKKPAEQDLLVTHVEQDFENGSGGVIALPRLVCTI
ncbi:hypothetical protein RvY_10312 [Ramazzottius varieornatus]|uniref:SWIM-type domain-containing protein n=1 Tax=Ramazzottius varieornatus TaxID=947166 RepID=A0A1D1VCC7_RAMVA|nr:hypothetical protein RvY_10312 [Ramazzottius varieornatus]